MFNGPLKSGVCSTSKHAWHGIELLQQWVSVVMEASTMDNGGRRLVASGLQIHT